MATAGLSRQTEKEDLEDGSSSGSENGASNSMPPVPSTPNLTTQQDHIGSEGGSRGMNFISRSLQFVLGSLSPSKKPPVTEDEPEKGQRDEQDNELIPIEITPTPKKVASLPAEKVQPIDPDKAAISENASNTSLPRPTIAPGNLATRKRPPRSREDLYEIETSPERDNGAENEESRPAKRARTNKKLVGRAKPPLTRPKISGGKVISPQLKTAIASKAMSTIGSNSHQVVTSSPRGHTEKQPSSIAQSSPSIDNVENQLEEFADMDEGGKGSHPKSTEPDGHVELDGVSSILMDPSPIKVSRELPSFERGKLPTKLRSCDGSDPIPGDLTLRDGEDLRSPRSLLPSASGCLIDIDLLSDIKKELDQVGHKKTYNEGTSTYSWEAIKAYDQPVSVAAKELCSRVQDLLDSYRRLRRAESKRNVDHIRLARTEVSEAMEEFRSELNVITTREIPIRTAEEIKINLRQKRQKATYFKQILLDIYFNVLPKTACAIAVYALTYRHEGSMKTENLEEFLGLVELLHILATHTTRQPPDFQPKANNNDSYQVSQPSRRVMPKIRKLRQSLKAELAKRRQEAHIATQEQLQSERSSDREAAVRKEIAARDQKIRDRKRLQAEYFQKLLSDPSFSQGLRNHFLAKSSQQEGHTFNTQDSPHSSRAEEEEYYSGQEQARRERQELRRYAIKRREELHEQERARRLEEANARKRLQAEVFEKLLRTPFIVEHLPTDSKMAEGFDSEKEHQLVQLGLSQGEDPFAVDDNYEQVDGFPKNNVSDCSKEMTREEKKTMIKILRANRGKNRYELVASALDRSLEEVFDLCKELQEAMDRAREQGELGSTADFWTLDIWPGRWSSP